MVIIYDNDGKIWYNGSGNGVPNGLAFLDVEIPTNKYIERVDVNKTPHEPIFENYPKSEIDILKESDEQQQADIDYLLLLAE